MLVAIYCAEVCKQSGAICLYKQQPNKVALACRWWDVVDATNLKGAVFTSRLAALFCELLVVLREALVLKIATVVVVSIVRKLSYKLCTR
jgi:hypothetical protein